jgi:hypothetical protein
VIVTAAGDICGALPSSCDATANLIGRIDPDIVLALGDNQYPEGALTDYRASYDQTWGRFRERTRPVAGNHEWRTPDAQGYLDYFGLRRYWYTFTARGWRFYALDGTCADDGGCGPGSPQYAWLERSLQARSDRCILAYWHQPRFSSGIEHGSDDGSDPFWRLLFAAGAELVLNGHEHNYERFAPQDPDAEPRDDGIVEIVAGTGRDRDDGYPFGAPIPNSQVRLNATGLIRLALLPHRWTARFVRSDGSVLDRTSGTC